jgi:hypothetical protein
LDGEALPFERWRSPIPVDAGHHRLVARTAQRSELHEFDIAEAVHTEVRVPGLLAPASAIHEPAPVATVHQLDLARAPAPNESTGPRDQTALGYAVVGIGVAGVAAGALLGLLLNTKVAQLRDHCPDFHACDLGQKAAVTKLQGQARPLATGANLGFIAGATAIVAGVVLVLASPSASEASQRWSQAQRARQIDLALYHF